MRTTYICGLMILLGIGGMPQDSNAGNYQHHDCLRIEDLFSHNGDIRPKKLTNICDKRIRVSYCKDGKCLPDMYSSQQIREMHEKGYLYKTVSFYTDSIGIGPGRSDYLKTLETKWLAVCYTHFSDGTVEKRDDQGSKYYTLNNPSHSADYSCFE